MCCYVLCVCVCLVLHHSTHAYSLPPPNKRTNLWEVADGAVGRRRVGHAVQSAAVGARRRLVRGGGGGAVEKGVAAAAAQCVV